MNSNSDVIVKQEYLTAEELLVSSIRDTDLNILVKNEPISDEPSAITIKNEPQIEDTCLIETVSVKTEQNQDIALSLGDSFVIYELETQTQKTGKEIPKESCATPHVQIKNTVQAATKAFHSTAIPLDSNFNQNDLVNKKSITTEVAGPPPILLNEKFRKRNKVIIAAKLADKKKRYNIERTPSELSEKGNNTSVSKIGSSISCRLINSGNKKVINHLMKHKQKQKDLEEVFHLSKPSINVGNNITKTLPDTFAPFSPKILTSPATVDILTTPKQLGVVISIIPELRVKCLCSLIDDTARDDPEIRDFFQEMFIQTRCLKKAQQRIIKRSLLEAICNAEDAVEQGKCCSF